MKRTSSKRGQRGQSMVEATLVLLVFFTLLLGVIDCGQVLFAHQSLVERVRTAVRWGVVHPWNEAGGADAIVNLILYNQTGAPSADAPGFLGLQRENVVVRHQSASPDRPDDETLRVTIVNFRSQFFSPWIATAVMSPRAVSITAPMASRHSLSSAQRDYPQP
jgi:hypothetical protein